jgi:hypothetical protein
VIDPQAIQTQVSTISAVGNAVQGWESRVATCVWVQPTQDCHNSAEIERLGDE